MAIAELTSEQLDRLYRDLEQRGKAVRFKHDGKTVGTCRTAGVTCKAQGCSPVNHAGLKPKTVRHVHGMLHKALQDAADRGHLGRNVADMANPPTARQTRSRRAREQCWTAAQLQTYLAFTSGGRLAPVWQLIATTGMRRGEICGLRWEDIDLDRGRLRVAQTITEVRGRPVEQHDGKSDAAARTLALDRRTVDVLREWRARQAEDKLACAPAAWSETGLAFTNENGHGYRPRRISASCTRAAAAAGLPRIGAHGLRHTYATIAHMRGVASDATHRSVCNCRVPLIQPVSQV